MESDQDKAFAFFKERGIISVAFLMRKMQIKYDLANKLYLVCLRQQAQEWFYFRRFGSSYEEIMIGEKALTKIT